MIMPADSTNLEIFWDKLSDWTCDNRIVLASKSWLLVSDWASENIWTTNPSFVPKYLSKEVSKIFSRILTQSPLEHSAGVKYRSSEPSHNSEESESMQIFLAEIEGCFSSGQIAAIASAIDLWEIEDQFVSILDFEYLVPLAFRPNGEIPVPREQLVHNYFRDSRIIIVGGKRTPEIANSILEVSGIDASSLVWFESDSGKPPRDLDKRLSDFCGKKSHLVMVWGKIGHATSKHVNDACDRVGYSLILPRRETRITDELISRAVGDA